MKTTGPMFFGKRPGHPHTEATSSLACVQYIVHPTWLTESLAAQRRLPERRFSLMAEISRGRAALGPRPKGPNPRGSGWRWTPRKSHGFRCSLARYGTF